MAIKLLEKLTYNQINMQFKYTRKEKIEKPQVNGQEQPEEFKDMTDTFNIDCVIRTVERSDGSRLVVLNDFHEEMRDIPQFNKKREYIGVKKERNTYQSEIVLTLEDSENFMKLHD